ncbi:MAG: Spy/CpxP family protein refolding chaperone [Methylococcales bacterium]
MKKQFLIYALILCIPLIAAALPGEGGGGDWHRGMKIERLTQELNLTGEQKTQMEVIFKDQRAKHKALREEGRARMKKVLNDEQMKKMAILRERHHERWKQGKACPKE